MTTLPRRADPPGLSLLRVTIAENFHLGPGRADLLEAIARTGSISAAGKAMDMSYKKAWSLVQALNEGFGAPMVETERGGAGQGGAQLTEAGKKVLAHYRAMQDKTRRAIAEDLAAIQADMSIKK
ncbi:molybdate transport system regulatory protein [Devosia enhydra]|uniref:Molybdate transport system regulatory protein n=1 Tax=Devosia enhydra TaxID=665118 RepID=A0A1K2I4H1_9HYPH|nr:LysR family transcriptional regulator [Devosia enhydra]SFZ86628.1 molybdate transport system regulatory protein [Devosia enhydra]